jgi:hypothetical protein
MLPADSSMVDQPAVADVLSPAALVQPVRGSVMDKKMLPNSRRELLGLAAAGAVLGVVGARPAEAQERQQPVDPGPPRRQPQPVDPGPIRGRQQPVAPQPTFTSWVHGHSVVVERGVLGEGASPN